MENYKVSLAELLHIEESSSVMALTRLVQGIREQILPEIIIVLFFCEIDGLYIAEARKKSR